MKKFKVTVNGTAYEVEVEEISGLSTPPTAKRPAADRTAPPPPAAAPAPAAEPTPRTPAPKPAKTEGGGTVLKAPMPGTILAIKVKEGETISKGQVLLVLEAMKMENEIMAIADGKVISINVSKGAAVRAGDPLIILDFN